MRRAISERLDDLEQVIAATCCLVASSAEIPAMQVITTGHPTYPELMRYRAVAEAHDCTMTVSRSVAGSAIRFHAARPSLR